MTKWSAAAFLCVPSLIEAAVVGDCARCHPAEVKLHERTRMARAMVPALESAFARNLSGHSLRESNDGYQFEYHATAAGLQVRSARGNDTAGGMIEWVLGAGAQGQTPLVRASNGMLESRVSYFPQLNQYGITIGQEAGNSPNALAALGRRQSSRDLQSCLGCHATAITRDLEPVIPGVQCQRCHPGADDHAQGGKAPLNPGTMSAEAQARFCGNCHRTKPPVDDAQLENVRFQPLRLMKSRCYASRKLACTTCHPAHQDARRNDAPFYNEKCHLCHEAQPAHTDGRQKGDCIGCHMPYVQLHPALKFTDHFIRVIKPGDLPEAIILKRPSGA